MKNRIFGLATSLLLINMVAACTAADFRKSTGISKPAPDEFLVIPRDNLKIPGTATALPKPGDAQDEAVVASNNGREAVFGKSTDVKTENSVLESVFLAKTGANKTDDAIRKTIEEDFKNDTGVFGTEKDGTLESVLDPFGYNRPADPTVDGKAENKRIRALIAKGEKVPAKGVKKVDAHGVPEEEKSKKKNEWEYQDNIILNKPKPKKEPENNDESIPVDKPELN